MGNYLQKLAGLLFLAAILSINNLQAQTTLGLKGGVNFPSWQVSMNGLDINTSKSTKFLVGGFLNYPLNESVSIQPELLYQVMGTKTDTSSIEQNYLTIPLLFKFALTDLLSIEAGPQLGILLGAASKTDTILSKKDFKATDFQFVFGGGINLTEKIHAGFRYGYGLSNIMSNSNTSLFEGAGLNSSIKNNSFSIILSYTF